MQDAKDVLIARLRARSSPTALLPEHLKWELPKIGKQSRLGGEAIVHIKYFSPYGPMTWFVLEFDGKDEFFGIVEFYENLEYGYFSLSEFFEQGALIERDEHFKPTKVDVLFYGRLVY
jgi:hypothetical protein